MSDINSYQWWEEYFERGNWEANGGNAQTLFFGKVLLENIRTEYLMEMNEKRYEICDFGCACGEFTYLLGKKLPECNVTGMDISKAAIKRAKRNYCKIEFMVQDIFESHKKFDVIFCSNVLEYFENPYKILEKLLRLTRKYLVVMVPYKEEALDLSHNYRFTENDFLDNYGDFNVLQRTIINTSKMENTYWRGEQLLVVMKRDDISFRLVNENEGTFTIPGVWDKVSEDYKIEIDKSEFQLAEEIARIFVESDVKAPAKIIELGCGSGHLSACLAMKGYEVTLLDFSDGALTKAKKTFQKYGIEGRFIKGDIFDLSNLHEQYDLVWNSGVMEHFSSDNLGKIYCSIMNIAKQRFIFLVPNPDSISYLMMRYNLQGNQQWEYGMEYLRTNYVDIARSVGFYGKTIGYAALSISKWHFYSTFSDSINSRLYSKMVEDDLMPENEAYLVAYELTRDMESGDREYIEENDTKKERIFELSALNFSLVKENAACKGQMEAYETQLKDLREDYAKVKAYETQLKDLQEDYAKICGEKLDIQTHYENVNEERETLSKQNEGLREENRKLFEGITFNQKELERLQRENFEVVQALESRIKSETAKIQEYIGTSGFSKIIRIHAVLGVFKNAVFKTKCKMIIKAFLRCLGIKKSFYTENVRMDFKIRNCVNNIENMITIIKNTVPHAVMNNTENVTDGLTPCISDEEVIVAMEPKISILLPVYNHAEFIRDAIKGVQCQTYKNWELIIINDGSTDNLTDILKEYTGDPRIRMYTQDNQRLPNTLTNLHNLATGQFVTWTSADNIMEPQMLEILSKHLLLCPDAVMVYADVAIIDDRGDFLGYGYREMNRDKNDLHIMRLPHDTDALDAECDNYINACFMYRMNIVKALKGQYSADLEGLEDYDFWLRLRTFGKIVHICNHEPLYRYRVHANTMSEDLLKNKSEEHQRRSERMMEYSQAKDAYSYRNWNLKFEDKNSELEQCLNRMNYNYEKLSDKKVGVLSHDIPKDAQMDSLYVISKKDVFEIDYYAKDGTIEKRAEIYKGIDVPLLAKKVRQTSILGLFWEYPVKFANMPVIGCHINMQKISVEKTVDLLRANQDKLFSFCATTGGRNRQAEEQILNKCENAIFMGEKELGTPVYLYASWNMAFVPPMSDSLDYEFLPSILCAWSIGRWIMIEQDNFPKEILPFVSVYSCEETMLGLKEIQNISAVENILDLYIAHYSKVGAAKRVLAYLNGIGQDIFVERPDFQLIPKERKFPPMQLGEKYELPERLKAGYVAIMVDTLDKGGLEQVVAMLVKEFITRGMDVRVLCTDKGGLVADELKKRGVKVEEFGNNKKRFEEYIAKNPPILVNTHYARNMLEIVKNKNISIVEVIHNMYVFFNKEDWEAEREREKNFKKMIAVSDLVKDIYIKKHGSVDASKITVIGNCADDEKIYGANRMFVRDELGIGYGSTVFINVSSIDGRKNQLGLLTAFDMYFKSVNSDSYLILVGNRLSQFYDDTVVTYMGELDSKEHIIKLDYYRKITDLYNASDIFVMPSYFEGWSIAATEALYCGLPIIHSKCGSALELVKDGENGMMIENPIGDITACSVEQLVEYMVNRVPTNTEELLKAMSVMTMNLSEWKGKRGMISATALQDFSREKMIKSYIDCFDQCLRN